MKQVRFQRLSEAVAAEHRVTETVRQRVPDCRTGDREDPTTESANVVRSGDVEWLTVNDVHVDEEYSGGLVTGKN